MNQSQCWGELAPGGSGTHRFDRFLIGQEPRFSSAEHRPWQATLGRQQHAGQRPGRAHKQEGLDDVISEVLLSEQQIAKRVTELGAAIAADYAGLTPVLVGVLKGVFIFIADLMRAIDIPFEIDFLAISSYGAQSWPGQVRLIKDLDIDITGRHVLFVEDMIDTGLTLNYLLCTLQERKPASLAVCALFNKPRRRLFALPLRYVGFEIPDRFIVGYGLDYRQLYRNLPFVGVLAADVLLRDVDRQAQDAAGEEG